VRIVGSNFAYNRAIDGIGEGNGGAIWIPQARSGGVSPVSVEDCSFSSNTALTGGAITVERSCPNNPKLCQFDGKVSILRGTFRGNVAQAGDSGGGSCGIIRESGGAISIDAASLIADKDRMCFPENVVLRNLSFILNRARLGEALHTDIVTPARSSAECRSGSLSLSDVCMGCVSDSDSAGSGTALVSSSPYKLVLLSDNTSTLKFSSGLPRRIVIGSADFFGNSVTQDTRQVEKICVTVVNSTARSSLNNDADLNTLPKCIQTKNGLAAFDQLRLAHPESNVASESVQVGLKISVSPVKLGGLDTMNITVELRGCPSGKVDPGGKCIEASTFTLGYIALAVALGFLTVVSIAVTIKLKCIDKAPLTFGEFFRHLGHIVAASGTAVVGLIDLVTDLFSGITVIRSDRPHLNDLRPVYIAIMITACLASLFEFVVHFQLARVAAWTAGKKVHAEGLEKTHSGVAFKSIAVAMVGGGDQRVQAASADNAQIQELRQVIASKEAVLLVLACEDVPMIALVRRRSLAAFAPSVLRCG
jgi:hypothetical protein